MATLAEELLWLTKPSPAKIDLESFDDDFSALLVGKDQVDENVEVNKSNFRAKTDVLLADEDTRYAGETVSRKDVNEEFSDDPLTDDGK